jgi:CheY-like chemotaxis protein
MPESPGVLVIDASAQYRSLISAVLTDRGYEVVQASDASAAVEQLGKRAFSVVLLDLKMPHNGIAFIDYLSEALPLVLARTIAFVPWVDRPIWGVLPKPFQMDELVKTVAACANHQG